MDNTFEDPALLNLNTWLPNVVISEKGLSIQQIQKNIFNFMPNLWQDILYRFVRCNWKIACHRWNKPLFWSFCPTERHWMVFVFTCLWPRPWRNLYRQEHISWYDYTAYWTAHATDRPSFTVLPPTCSVLMQDLMSLSVFSHSDIRVPVSAFIPCRSEICKQNVSLDCWCVGKCLCTPVCDCMIVPLTVSERGGKAESVGNSGGRPAVWEVWELEHN